MLIRWVKRFRIFAAFLIFLTLFAFWGYAYIEPKSPLASWFFQIHYDLAPDKDSYLKQYQRHLDHVDGGWVSPRCTTFLKKRVLSDIDDQELDAILNFSLLHPQGSSVLWAWVDADQEELTARVIARFVERLSEKDEHSATMMKVIEEFRLGRSFGKDGHVIDRKEGGSKKAIEALREWWDTDLPWEKKRLIDPFKETGFDFFRGI